MERKKTKGKTVDNGLRKEESDKAFARKKPSVELRFFNPLPGCSESETEAWLAGKDILEGD